MILFRGFDPKAVVLTVYIISALLLITMPTESSARRSRNLGAKPWKFESQAESGNALPKIVTFAKVSETQEELSKIGSLLDEVFKYNNTRTQVKMSCKNENTTRNNARDCLVQLAHTLDVPVVSAHQCRMFQGEYDCLVKSVNACTDASEALLSFFVKQLALSGDYGCVLEREGADKRVNGSSPADATVNNRNSTTDSNRTVDSNSTVDANSTTTVDTTDLTDQDQDQDQNQNQDTNDYEEAIIDNSTTKENSNKTQQQISFGPRPLLKESDENTDIYSRDPNPWERNRNGNGNGFNIVYATRDGNRNSAGNQDGVLTSHRNRNRNGHRHQHRHRADTVPENNRVKPDPVVSESSENENENDNGADVYNKFDIANYDEYNENNVIDSNESDRENESTTDQSRDTTTSSSTSTQATTKRTTTKSTTTKSTTTKSTTTKSTTTMSTTTKSTTTKPTTTKPTTTKPTTKPTTTRATTTKPTTTEATTTEPTTTEPTTTEPTRRPTKTTTKPTKKPTKKPARKEYKRTESEDEANANANLALYVAATVGSFVFVYLPKAIIETIN